MKEVRLQEKSTKDLPSSAEVKRRTEEVADKLQKATWKGIDDEVRIARIPRNAI